MFYIDGNSKVMMKFVYCRLINNCPDTVYCCLSGWMTGIEMSCSLKNLASIFQHSPNLNVLRITLLAKKMIDVFGAS